MIKGKDVHQTKRQRKREIRSDLGFGEKREKGGRKEGE